MNMGCKNVYRDQIFVYFLLNNQENIFVRFSEDSIRVRTLLKFLISDEDSNRVGTLFKTGLY